MERYLSFSRSGIQLDVDFRSIKPKDQKALEKVLSSKASTLLRNLKPKSKIEHPKQKLGMMSRLIPRSVASSFQKCHVPVQHINAIYNQKIELTKKRHHFYSMKKFNEPCYFDSVRDFYTKQHDQQQKQPCDKLLRTMVSQKWSLTSSPDNQGETRTMRSETKLLIPFEKQTQRPFDQLLKKLQQQSRFKSKKNKSIGQFTENNKKSNSVHRFQSYSRHDFLNPQKIATFSSGMNTHQIDLKKFKEKKHQTHLKIDKFVNEIKTRYDRDCPFWLTKLDYESKNILTRSQREVRQFEKQINRKMNEVHSKYPMRLAM